MAATPTARLDELAAHVTKAESRHASWVSAYRSYLSEYSKRNNSLPRRMELAKGDEFKVAFGWVETFVGRVTGYTPDITVSPRQREAIFAAMVAEDVVDYWFEHLNFESEWIKAIRNVGIGGLGWIKVGWNKASTRQDRVLKVSRADFDQMKSLQEEIAGIMGNAPTTNEIYKYLQDRLAQVRIGEPTCYSVRPEEMLFDPYCTSLASGQPRWIMHRYWRSVRDVKRDKDLSGRRNKIEETNVASLGTQTVWGDMQQGGIGGDPMPRTRISELYDIENQQLIIYADDDIKAPLFDEEIPFATGHPFVPLLGWEVEGSPYPMGIIELAMDQIKGINEQRAVTMAIRAGQIPKNLVSDKLVGAGQNVQEVLKSRIPNDTAVVKNFNGESISAHIHRLEGNVISQDWYAADGQLKADGEWVLGLNEISRGSLADGTHRSAAEVTSAMQAGGDRVSAIVNSCRRSVAIVARKMIGHAKQYMTNQDVVRIRGFANLLADAQRRAISSGAAPQAGPEAIMAKMAEAGGFFTPDGDAMFPFDGRTIDGEFEFSIDVGPKLAEDAATRSQNALQMLQVLAPFQEVNKAELIRWALEKGWDMKDATQFISMQQPQMLPEQGGIPSMAGSGIAQPGASVAPGLTPQ